MICLMVKCNEEDHLIQLFLLAKLLHYVDWGNYFSRYLIPGILSSLQIYLNGKDKLDRKNTNTGSTNCECNEWEMELIR